MPLVIETDRQAVTARQFVDRDAAAVAIDDERYGEIVDNVIRVFENITSAGVIARNTQEKSQLRDFLLWVRGQMFCIVGATLAGFATGFGRKDFFGRPVLLLPGGGLFGANVGGAEERGGE
jgi:hypothetical protein